MCSVFSFSFSVHLYLKDDPLQAKFRTRVAHEMERRLAKKPELAQRLIPDWVSDVHFLCYLLVCILKMLLLVCRLQERNTRNWISR